MGENEQQEQQPRSARSEAASSTSKKQPVPPPPPRGASCSTATTLLLLIILVGGGAVFLFAFFGGASAPPAETPPPQPTIHSRVAVLSQVQQLSRLETVQYTLRDVVRAEKEGGILGIGAERNLLIIHGTAVAGIDFGTIGEHDVVLSDDGMSITMQLPPAEIFAYSLDHSQTELYDSSTGLFTSASPDLILKALQEGERRVLLAACEDGIMDRATDYAKLSVERFLAALGFTQVTVVAAPVPECPLPPLDAPPLTTPTPTATPLPSTLTPHALPTPTEER